MPDPLPYATPRSTEPSPWHARAASLLLAPILLWVAAAFYNVIYAFAFDFDDSRGPVPLPERLFKAAPYLAIALIAGMLALWFLLLARAIERCSPRAARMAILLTFLHLAAYLLLAISLFVNLPAAPRLVELLPVAFFLTIPIYYMLILLHCLRCALRSIP